MTTTQIIRDVIADRRYGREWLVDGRKRATKAALAIGFSKQEIAKMRLIRTYRLQLRYTSKSIITHADRIRFLHALKECAYDPTATSSCYNCTGIDWKAFHRASSNGKGWVLIAPDEPANNWYIEDGLLVKYLTNKFQSL